DGGAMTTQDWGASYARAVTMALSGATGDDEHPDDPFLILLNGWWEPLDFSVPVSLRDLDWRVEVDKADPGSSGGTVQVSTAGRLLTKSEPTAAIAAVVHCPLESSKSWGPFQRRASVPRPTVSANSSPSARRSSRGRRRRSADATTPSASTGNAALGRTTTRMAATMVAATPSPTRNGGVACSLWRSPPSRYATARNADVTAQATRHGGSISVASP